MEKRRTSIVIIFFMLNICSDLFYKLIKFLIAKLTYYILINCSLDDPLFLFFCKYEYLSKWNNIMSYFQKRIER